MTTYRTPWPPPPSGAWPETKKDSTGLGTDYPGSAGDREGGKFRPSATPRLTQVAVVNDDGSPIISASLEDARFAEIVLYLRAIAYGIADLTSRSLDELVQESAPDE